jgi:nucleoside-diphosphate-sugar epimerase
MTFTVLGAGGYIGSRLVETVSLSGRHCRAVMRGDRLDPDENHGHVIFCTGLMGDFRSHPLEAVEAHVIRVVEFLRSYRFESFLYLSSTRVYDRVAQAWEDAELVVDPTDPEDLYNPTKLAGEAACLSVPDPWVRVVRISNVYGGRMNSPSFLTDVITAALAGHVRLWTHLDSNKDYVHIDDVCSVLPRIALLGRERIYNVASGTSMSNRSITSILARETGCSVDVVPAAPIIRKPLVDTTRLIRDFAFLPLSLEQELPKLVRVAARTASAV